MFWRRRSSSDFDAEINAHLQFETERLKEQGLSQEEAEMAARRAFGNVSQARAESDQIYQFVILPRFYETWPFRTLIAVTVMGLAFLAYRWRLTQLRRYFAFASEERFAERSRIAREIHDTLLQGLTGASLELQAVETQIGDRLLRDRLSFAVNHIEKTMSDTRLAIWNMRSEELDLGSAARGSWPVRRSGRLNGG